jgi:hypothetical protein
MCGSVRLASLILGFWSTPPGHYQEWSLKKYYEPEYDKFDLTIKNACTIIFPMVIGSVILSHMFLEVERLNANCFPIDFIKLLCLELCPSRGIVFGMK